MVIKHDLTIKMFIPSRNFSKICDIVSGVDANIDKKVALALKRIMLTSNLLTLATSLYVLVMYTFKLDGGLVTIQFIVHNLMQILISTGYSINSDDVVYLLNEEYEKIFNKYRYKYISLTMVAVSCIWMSLVVFIIKSGAKELYLTTFGFEGNEFDGTQVGYMLASIGILEMVILIILLLLFSIRYSTLVYAISLLARQNLSIIDSWPTKLQLATLNKSIFTKLEEIYLVYIESVEKINRKYSIYPLWFFMGTYVGFITIGTFSVVSTAKSSTLSVVIRQIFVIIIFFLFFFMLIRMCNTSSTSMEHFHRRAVKLVNSHIKVASIREPTCESLANALRSIPLPKIKAGSYDIEYSLLISLVASAVPMTVMVVSLLKELKK